jgi:hypothetical protein
MAKISTFTDDFSGTLAAWTVSGGVSIVSGAMQMLPTISAGNYDPPALATSDDTYDLTDDEFVVELLQGLPVAAVEHWLAIRLRLDGSNYVEFWMYNGGGSTSFQPRHNVAGTTTALATETYSSTDHRWLKISHASGTIRFWRSADGENWIEIGSGWSPSFAITALDIHFVYSGYETPSAAVRLDNVNLPPAPSTPDKVATFTDDFAGTLAKWTHSGGVSIVSGRMNLHPTIAVGAYDPPAIASSTQVLDFENSSLIFEVPQFPPAAPEQEHYISMGIGHETDDDRVEFFVYCAPTFRQIYARRVIGGTATTIWQDFLDTSNHRWLRVRHDGTNVIWETGSNGTAWTQRGTWAPTFNIDRVRIRFNYSGERTPSASTQIDNINLPPTSLSHERTVTDAIGSVDAISYVGAAVTHERTIQDYVSLRDTVNRIQYTMGQLPPPTDVVMTAIGRVLSTTWVGVAGASTYEWEVEEFDGVDWILFQSGATAFTSFTLMESQGVGWGRTYRPRVRAMP